MLMRNMLIFTSRCRHADASAALTELLPPRARYDDGDGELLPRCRVMLMLMSARREKRQVCGRYERAR